MRTCPVGPGPVGPRRLLKLNLSDDYKEVTEVCLLSSMSDSGSSQGLSQPSTHTTQYLRADTPNNAAPVTSEFPSPEAFRGSFLLPLLSLLLPPRELC